MHLDIVGKTKRSLTTSIAIAAACSACTLSAAEAKMPEWQPSAGHKQILIWPKGREPNPQTFATPENETTLVTTPAVAGKPWIEVNKVFHPTITVYSPQANNTGAAVIVFPGGGYQILAIDLEGTEVCDWLASKGITGVLLKYRVPGEGRWPTTGHYPKSPVALEDAQRALRMVRANAAEYHIDPHKIGVLGFSAGGHLSAAISNHFKDQIYKPIDAIDKQSSRPDFAVSLYPGHLSLYDDKTKLNTDIHVTSATPPTFIVQAEDDPVDDVENSLVYFAALRRAKVPTEMHLYAHGGHAFGLRRTQFPITEWPSLVEKWLSTIGMVPAAGLSDHKQH